MCCVCVVLRGGVVVVLCGVVLRGVCVFVVLVFDAFEFYSLCGVVRLFVVFVLLCISLFVFGV